jgi:hypothetical protein
MAMFRVAFAFGVAALFCVPMSAEEKKPTVNLTATLPDRDLQKEAPESGLIVSQKAWDKLVKAWDIKDAPKVDFDKEFLIVATTVGSRLHISTKLSDKGDLELSMIATDDLRPGFKYVIQSVSRAGVKTVNGKELPKE